MVQRCSNSNNPGYKDYGGRGITVCQRWLKYENFLADMGRKPSPQHSIDRIDNEANYEPSNCHWATNRQQANNARRNRLITAFGETMTISQWSAKVGIPYMRLYMRLERGSKAEVALSVVGDARFLTSRHLTT